METAAAGLGVEATDVPVQSDSQIEAAMMMASARQRGGGLVAIPDSFTASRRELIIALAERTRTADREDGRPRRRHHEPWY